MTKSLGCKSAWGSTKAHSVLRCGVQLHRKYEVTGQFRVKLINFNSPPPLLITHKGINLLGDYNNNEANTVQWLKGGAS